ncbi:GNAT family N-acetyltransferase [Tabrizicola sp.]|uniref:GNAT family N-acetyltransferase n=1 Tax=Tabrizicola sp. TaxID=2005166 RepID=UPI0035B26306
MIVREESAGDIAEIRNVTEAAFQGADHSSGTEAAIIDALRSAGRLTLSLVAEADGRIVGHVAFSPVTIAGEDIGWSGLGPVSVLPQIQGKGIGGALIRNGLSRIRSEGWKGCVVVGDPAYYQRFGFAPEPGLVFEGVPPEYFMALTFAGPTPSGNVIYEPAFYP